MKNRNLTMKTKICMIHFTRKKLRQIKELNNLWKIIQKVEVKDNLETKTLPN